LLGCQEEIQAEEQKHLCVYYYVAYVEEQKHLCVYCYVAYVPMW